MMNCMMNLYDCQMVVVVLDVCTSICDKEFFEKIKSGGRLLFGIDNYHSICPNKLRTPFTFFYENKVVFNCT